MSVQLSPEFLLRGLWRFVVFHAAVQVSGLLVGAFFPVGRFAAIGVILFAAFLAMRSRPLVAGGEAEPDAPDPGSHRSDPFRGLFWSIVGFSVIVTFALLVASLLGRDQSWDGNAYHIPAVHLWSLHGSVYWIDDRFDAAQFMNGYPKAVEFLSFLLVRASGMNNAVTAGGFLFLPLGCLAAAFLARFWGAGALSSLAAGALWILIPVNIAQGTTTYVDAAYASTVAASLALIAVMLAERGRSGMLRRSLAAGCALGLACAVKGSGVVFCGAALAVVCAKLLRQSRRDVPAMVSRITVLLFGAVLVCGYWYARNWIFKGNPLYPVEVKAGPFTVFAGIPLDAILDSSQIPREFASVPAAFRPILSWIQIGLRLPAISETWYDTVYGFDGRLGGLGFLWIAGCLPAALYLWFFPPAGKALRAVLLIALAAFLLQPMNWWPRYTAWIYGAGLPCFGAVLSRIFSSSSGSGTLRRASAAWMIAILFVFCFESLISLWNAVTGGSALNRAALMRALDRRYSSAACYVEPVRGLSPCPFASLWNDSSLVLVGPLSTVDESGKYLLLGEISQPVGMRRFEPLREDVGPQEIAGAVERGARHVILDDALAVPEAVRAKARSVRHVGGFYLIELSRAP